MRYSSSLRIWISVVAVTIFILTGSAPLFAQANQNSHSDIQFHKFVPIVPPENSKFAASTASDPAQVNSAISQQIQLLMQEKASRTPAQQKIDSNVLYTIRMMRGQEAAPGVTSLYTGVDLDQNNRIVVDIVADVTDALLKQLEAAGALVLDSHKDYRAIRAIVPPDQIEIIAASPAVTFIGRKVESMVSRVKLPQPAHALAKGALAPGFEARATAVRKQIAEYLQQHAGTNSTPGTPNTGSGSVDTEGDAAHQAARARGLYGVSGAGLKIGVLSDSANSTGAATAAQATGDLPPTCPGPGGSCLTIVQDFAGTGGTDEGAAMLEIVHDMAPGATLFFATADISEASFATNIQNLRSVSGCDIIVDDVFYFDESPFQDGVIAQAVTTVMNAGAMYFSSAGNEGNVAAGTSGYFEGDFNDAGSPAFIFPGGAKTGTIHNFGSVATPVNGDIITGTSTGEAYTLNWADPAGLSGNDYDLFVVNSAGTIKAQSTNIQNGTQNPFEMITPPALIAGDRLVVFKGSGAASVAFALNTLRGTLTNVTTGQTHGHSAVAGAFSVAAAPAAAAFNGVAPVGPFPNAFTTSNLTETFTSDGPRRKFFNPNGTPITAGQFTFASGGGTLVAKPDITAADGVSTTLPGASGLNPFYGTSAAAPHAASIAALILAAKPTLTPAQIRTVLTSTALDIDAAGNDIVSGNGIVMALAALNSLGISPGADPEIGAVTASENPGNGNGIIEAGEGASLVIQLKNQFGVVNATGITATLTTITPGVTITQPATSAYADLAAGTGAGNNLSPFTFTVASNAACGLNIEFILTVTFTGGSGVTTRALNFSVQTGLITISNSLGGATPIGMPAGMTFATGTQTGRLVRTLTASVCGTNKANPLLTTNVGSRTFDAYTLTPNTAGCMNVTLNSANGLNLFNAAYNSGGFVPANPSTNYLADPGNDAISISYGVSANAGTGITFVVHELNPGTGIGSPYTLTIPSCVVTPAGSVNHPPTALAHNVTVTATTFNGTAAASIDNGSSDPDAGDTITKTQNPPGPYPVGVTSVTLTVTDSKGAIAQATANVTVVNPVADLTITKTHVGNFTQGQTGANYAITVTNSGASSGPTSGTVTVVDTLPASMTATALTGSGWTCTLATLTCTRSDVLAATIAYPTITLTVTVSGTAPASVTNTATVSGGGETNTANDVANDSTTIVTAGAADLTVTKSHTGNFTQGQVGAAYTVTVTNSGGSPTTGTVTLADTMPTGLSATAIAGTGWTCTLVPLQCTRADALANGSSYPVITVTVTVATNAGATVTNSVTVSGGGETNVANDTATNPTIITQLPDLTITASHVGNFTSGQPGVYTLTVNNVGNGPTSGTVTATDTLPVGLTATTIVGTGWTCTTTPLSCTRVDALAATSSYPPITLTVNVPSTVSGSLTNSASVSGGGEIISGNDSTTDGTVITGVPDMTLLKQHSGNFTQGEVGDTYRLTATNSGSTATTGTVTVVDTLPTGLTATAIAGGGWTCTLATLTCTRADSIGQGVSYPQITVTVTVAANAPATVTNTAAVSGGGETNTANNSASDPTTVLVPSTPDLTITKTHVGNFTQGQVGATYTITATNSGNAATTGTVTVVDTLPTGLTATAFTGSGWTCTLATVTCTRADAIAGGGASYPAITLSVTVAANAVTPLNNLVTISGGGETNTANDTATNPTTVVQLADMIVASSHAGNFTQGQTGAIYTILVSNIGTGPTQGTVVVNDILPASLTATAMSGTGWTCTFANQTCTRSDVLLNSASYPVISLTVNVSATAPASVQNSVAVSGGGEANLANDSGTDTTTINLSTNPVPTVTTVSPTSIAAGSVAFTLTVNGTNFIPSSTVNFKGAAKVTTFVSSTQLTAQIQSLDVSTAGNAAVFVSNPTPGGGSSNSVNFTISGAANPLPSITGVTPNTVNAGTGAFTLTVNGTNFISNSVVDWLGSPRPTTFVNATTLTAAITAADIQTVVAALVVVVNPAPGGGTSNTFIVNVITPTPTLTTLVPNSAIAGGAAFTLTVNGTSFENNATVLWNGGARTTTFVSATQLTAAITASDIAGVGTASVVVFNPNPTAGGANTIRTQGLAVGTFSNALTFTITSVNPVPVLTSISPNNASAGSGAFTLTVNGSGFIHGSVVNWAGSARTTTFVSATQLTAAITAADIQAVNVVNVNVFNPTPGGGTSVNLPFTITTPVPAITTLTPNTAIAGGAAFTLTVTGSNLINTSVVQWNGSNRTTTFVNATTLQAAITAADILTAGTASVRVFTPTVVIGGILPQGGPSGVFSNALTFTITAANPLPTLTSIAPTSVGAGGAAFTLTLTGTNFISSSVAQWKGSPRTTTFVSATQLTAAITAADIATSGTAAITVVNPTPGGGTSNSLTFTVTDFSVTSSTGPQTVAAGQSANFSIATAPVGGAFAGNVTFTTSALPQGAAASFSPSSVAPGSSTTMTITTTARGSAQLTRPPSSPSGPMKPLWLIAFVMTLALASLTLAKFGRKRMRRLIPIGAFALLLISAGYLSGCSGGGFPKVGSNTGTPAGTYPITVTGTSGTVQHSTTVTLIVQ